ncbi:MAG: YbhB/YbcL family Raf kinase inhibitor-like protein [Burkholderiaceae bacterium]
MLENLPDAFGHALRDQRAGLDRIAFHKVDLRGGAGAIMVSSLAFADHAPIPEKYSADGEGMSPPLAWSGFPAASAALLLIVEDADSPTPQPLVNAIVVNLTIDAPSVAEGALPSADHEGAGLRMGLNSLLQSAWLPLDPPPGHGVHRYAFQVFALETAVEFDARPGREAVLDAIAAHGLASGCLIGTYVRPDTSVPYEDAVLQPAGATLAT